MARDIKLEIDGKLHKMVTTELILDHCFYCSIKDLCEEVQGGCVAKDLTGTYFVEQNIEK